MNLSYLITCSTETETLIRLLNRVYSIKDPDDEMVIVIDKDAENNQNTKDILSQFASKVCEDIVERKVVRILEHPLNKNYGEHKNWGIAQCNKEWIFQLDGDECPTETLLANIKDIILSNPGVELFYVPRINDYKGVTEEHARMWGWKLTPCPVCENRLIVNWYDPQGRVFLNAPSRIKWDRRLHEKIEGHTKYSFLPDDYDLALYHDKTIEKQIETNKRYNVWFTEKENRGHGVI